MSRRFLILFVATVTLAAAALDAGRGAASGGATLAWVAVAVLGIPALLGLGGLVRIVYLDARGAGRVRGAGRTGGRS